MAHYQRPLQEDRHLIQYSLEWELRSDQDEIPWKASAEEVDSLKQSSGRVIVVLESKYHISDSITLYTDKDGSIYVDEEDVQSFFEQE